MNEAMRDWVTNVDNTHYLIGSASGPHPFPKIVREFQRIISAETRATMLERYGRAAALEPIGFRDWVGRGYDPLAMRAEFQAGRFSSTLVDRILRRE